MLGEHTPADMTLGAYNSHPVRQMIALVGAYGKRALPSQAEIDKLGLGQRDRKALEVALKDVATLRDDPNRDVSARVEAERRAGEVVGGLPDEQIDPAWFTRETEDLTQLGPAELAAKGRSASGGWS